MNIATIRTTLTNGWNTVRAMGPIGIATKAVGVAGVGVALYNAHHWAKLKSYDKKNSGYADGGLAHFTNTQYLNNQNHLTSKIKQKIFNWKISENISGAWNATTGYVGGFISNLARNIIPIGASVGAICLSGKKGIASACALGACTVWSALRHTFSHTGHKV